MLDWSLALEEAILMQTMISTMESPYVKGLKIKRNHDNFRKTLVGGSLKAKNWWFDDVEFEPVFIDTYKEIQGIETDSKKGAYEVAPLYASQ